MPATRTIVRFCSGIDDTGRVAFVVELTPEAVMPGNGFALMELPSATAETVIKRDRRTARKQDIVNTAPDWTGTGKGNSE